MIERFQAYVLLSLSSQGKMPWSAATSDAQCVQMKESCDVTRLAADAGCVEVKHSMHCVVTVKFICSYLQLGDIVKMCRGLKSGEAVDYDWCRSSLLHLKDRKVSEFCGRLSPVANCEQRSDLSVG